MKKWLIMGGIALITICFSATGFAADWSFYGNARVSTFYEDVETGGTTTKNFSQSLQGNSRIGANVKVSDELIGRFEYGASGGNANVRHLYGEWTFGAGKLLVGHTDSPLNLSFSNQVYGSDSGMDPYGGVDALRQAMLQLTFGNFKIAVIEPDVSNLGVAADTTEVRLPKVEASYKLSFDSGYVSMAGGVQTYDLTDTSASQEHDVTTYILALGGQLQSGAFYIGGDFWVGQNVKPYNYNIDPNGDPAIVGSSLKDNDAYGFMIAAGYKMNPTFSFEAGYGYVAAEVDDASFVEDDTVAYYLQSTVTLAPGVFIVPEIGRVDKDEDNTNTGTAEADTVYAGIKWQINF